MTDPAEIETILTRNLTALQTRITAACSAAGRDSQDVRLIAVTKYAAWEWVNVLARIHRQFGESRPQQLVERAARRPDLEWHLIGHLQSNKVRQAVRAASVIHSIDSRKLLQRVSRIAEEEDRSVEVLLQVNISGEASKSGFDPDTLLQQWEDTVAACTGPVTIIGLMTMAPKSESADQARPVFAALRTLRDRLVSRIPDVRLTELSMGMSRDFDSAIAEGSTMIRVGSALFAGLPEPSSP